MPGSAFTGTDVGSAPFTAPCSSFNVAFTVCVTSEAVPLRVVSVVDVMPSMVPVVPGSTAGAGAAASWFPAVCAD